MIEVKLTSIMVNDQNRARAFYTEKLGFKIRHDVSLGDASWLTIVKPDDDGSGMEILLEPTGHPASVTFQKALYAGGLPLTQLYTADLAKEHAALTARGVVFKSGPKEMGPTVFADFDDTCGNIIRLVQG